MKNNKFKKYLKAFSLFGTLGGATIVAAACGTNDESSNSFAGEAEQRMGVFMSDPDNPN
jgi:hypothetical protein